MKNFISRKNSGFDWVGYKEKSKKTLKKYFFYFLNGLAYFWTARHAFTSKEPRFGKAKLC